MQPLSAVKRTVLSLGLITLFAAAAMADADRQGGVIHFSGEIVEPPCDISRSEQRLALSCSREGQTETRYYSFHELTTAPQHFKGIASVEMQYIDKQNKLAVMNIVYH
ncbi:type 1 fimbrial protein [Citrobacter rodentium]|jgi:P pilus assembly protein, pilin FimA|uniref:Exported protein n=2 Tax=Citrobacter rodentium TaxID=67825 RepID=D2TT51_CITRI|nr:type 1 fimbrial protein [Citrobacter rodentium]KIQ49501.1 hypothetical protein TA05_20670 [Citrobacter rodentium]QBY27727.1 type 1 fimbrial protein [Citrobacter rodentium]UHO30376.1 type 1 fimbrial protein [Citrobacter rodentium NBRC 105723 = DSM 16636]CBG87875.1 putative exported protein [Citrobacter rodentium ICC168]HAT8014773.1 type 1 fimbrial protein [Citrobacter rodentium NBRC 105723 = DSM 16636]